MGQQEELKGICRRGRPTPGEDFRRRFSFYTSVIRFFSLNFKIAKTIILYKNAESNLFYYFAQLLKIRFMTKSKCGIIAYDKHDRIMLVKGREKLLWGFPKGSRKMGESNKTCAQREFYEETGNTILLTDEETFIRMNRCYYITNISTKMKTAPKDNREIIVVKLFNIQEIMLLKRVTSDLNHYRQRNVQNRKQNKGHHQF